MTTCIETLIETDVIVESACDSVALSVTFLIAQQVSVAQNFSLLIAFGQVQTVNTALVILKETVAIESVIIVETSL